MNLLRLVLVALAAARATRFVTTDSLGEWTLVRRAKRWAWNREAWPHVEDGSDLPEDVKRTYAEDYFRKADPSPMPDPEWGWRSKLVSGLSCPFCVGFWIGVLVLLGEVVTRRWRPLRAVWTFALGALGLNYAVGHVSSRID